MTGTDQGLITHLSFLEERLTLKVGAFNGSSLNLRVVNSDTVGPVFSGFIDAHPLGKLPPIEGELARGGAFRFGIGFGTLFRNGQLFDQTGYQATKFTDVRIAAAIRAAFFGVFLQGEYLRHQQSDELTSRPQQDTGAYVQGGYYYPIPTTKVAIQPLARFGITHLNQQFATEKVTSFEGGLAFFPRADLADPSALRIRVQYANERRTPETITSHVGTLDAQVKW